MSNCNCGFGICNGDGTCNCYDLWYINQTTQKCDIWVGDIAPKSYKGYLIFGVITSTIMWMMAGIVFFLVQRFKGKKIRFFQRFGVVLLLVSFIFRMSHDILAFSNKDIHKFTILLGWIWPTEISILYFQAVIWVFACKTVLGSPITKISDMQINVACIVITALSFLIEIFVSFLRNQILTCFNLDITKFRAVPLMVGVQSSILLNVWRIYLVLAALFIIVTFWVTRGVMHFKLKELLSNSKAVKPSERKQNRFRLLTKITVSMNITLIFSLVVPSLGFIFQDEPKSYVPVNFIIRFFELAIATEFLLGALWEVRRELCILLTSDTSNSEMEMSNSSEKRVFRESLNLK